MKEPNRVISAPAPNIVNAAAWMAAIVENSDDAILSKTLNGIITTWNPGACRLFGYSAAEAIGKSIGIVIPDGWLNEELRILARLRAGERVEHFETVRRHKDGTLINISLSVSPVRDSGGLILGASKIARGLTNKMSLALVEKLKAERRLRDLQNELYRVSRLTALGDMASALAHELNQPITAIGNFLAGSKILLQRDDVVLNRVLGVIDQATRETVRAGQIIRRLREFVARGEADLRLESLADLIEEASTLALIGARENGVRVRIELSPEVQLVLADKVQIQQVVFNMIRNAVDAMAESERRELHVRAMPIEGEMVIVTVADTGPGIPSDVYESLFQPFVTTKRTGMGVGLSICRTIIEAHGGRIWVGPNEGGGALFSFTIPHVRQEESNDAD